MLLLTAPSHRLESNIFLNGLPIEKSVSCPTCFNGEEEERTAGSPRCLSDVCVCSVCKSSTSPMGSIYSSIRIKEKNPKVLRGLYTTTETTTTVLYILVYNNTKSATKPSFPFVTLKANVGSLTVPYYPPSIFPPADQTHTTRDSILFDSEIDVCNEINSQAVSHASALLYSALDIYSQSHTHTHR